MKIFCRFAFATLMLATMASAAVPVGVQAGANPGQNAALRYWSAFAQMQDVALTDPQVKQLNRILEGTAPFVETSYKDLIERNRKALETMARGAALPYCDWGIDYQLGPDAPVDYVRKALQLGRLNVLYALQLRMSDRAAAVRALAAGVRFSHDVANGGTLFAALAAKSLLAAHLRVIALMLQKKNLTPGERGTLSAALSHIGADGLNWQSAVKRELAVLRGPLPVNGSVQRLDPQALAALSRITSLYVSALGNPREVAELQKAVAGAPQPLPKLIPNPRRVVEQKQELTEELQKVKTMLK